MLAARSIPKTTKAFEVEGPLKVTGMELTAATEQM